MCIRDRGIAFPGDRPAVGNIVVTTGGTSDMAVAEEAALTAEVLGNKAVSYTHLDVYKRQSP